MQWFLLIAGVVALLGAGIWLRGRQVTTVSSVLSGLEPYRRRGGAATKLISRPRGKRGRLDPYLNDDGEALTARYHLLAGLSRKNPTLKIPEVRDGLLGLSGSVVEVGTFEKPGVQLWIDALRATPDSVDSDVQHAVAMVRALESGKLAALR